MLPFVGDLSAGENERCMDVNAMCRDETIGQSMAGRSENERTSDMGAEYRATAHISTRRATGAYGRILTSIEDVVVSVQEVFCQVAKG